MIAGRLQLILSDLHMPEMDGYTFVTEFRAYEAKTNFSRTPVIALTANIVQEELARAKALGMDDFLVKPLPGAQLKTMLEHWLPSSDSFAEASEKRSKHTTFSTNEFREKKINMSLFNAELLADMVGQESVNEILMDYQRSLVDTLRDLQQMIATHSWSDVAAAAHKLKSSSHFIGGELLAIQFIEMEHLAKQQPVAVKSLIEAYARLTNIAKTFTQQISDFIV